LSRGFTLKDLTPELGLDDEEHLLGVIRASERVNILSLGRTSGNAEMWDRFAATRKALTFEACYCSIIGDCWKSTLRTPDPVETPACRASPEDYMELGAGLDEVTAWPVLKKQSK
jgi:hypothetical protein